MGWFRLAPMRHEQSSDPLIRVFQSETAEIREDPEPFQLRLTLHALAGLVIALIAVSLLMQLNRVVASSAGQIVTSDPTIVLQALDASIIKSLDVQEGERVKGGQLLATLDPTFAAADVSAATLQIASLEAQVARAEAEIAHRDFNARLSAPRDSAYMALQRAYYVQRKDQYEAQLRAYDEQIAQNKATIRKLKDDISHYDDRVKISQEIESMRASLAASQIGSSTIVGSVVTIWPADELITLFICIKTETATKATTNPVRACNVRPSWNGSGSSRISAVSD